MNVRLCNERSADSAHFVFLKRDPDPEALEGAIKQLEDCVKHGLLFHAAQLSDWIMFVAADTLTKHPLLNQRVRLERLKRLGYLHFFEQERECRDDLCRTERLDEVLKSPTDPADDVTRWRLYTAIGHTMWHEEDLEKFRTSYKIYSELFSGLSERFDGRTQMEAFLIGIEGRLAFLERRSPSVIMEKFDRALSLLSDNQRRTRVGLHLINYYLNHLISLYVAQQTPKRRQQLSRRIEELFVEFDCCRIGTTPSSDGKLQPIKTLLQIHFGLHRLRKLTTDIDRMRLERIDTRALEHEIIGVKTELLFTSVMLGLGSLNPCPPLLREVYDFCADQGDGVDLNQVKAKLKSYLIEISWQGYEEIAAAYFRYMGHKVEELPERTRTFDLLVHIPATGFHSMGTIGVQVKHRSNRLTVRDFESWLIKAKGYDRRVEITNVIFITLNKPDVEMDIKKENHLDKFPLLREDIQFWSVEQLTERLWRSPGCLPEVYGLIEKWRRHNTSICRNKPTTKS